MTIEPTAVRFAIGTRVVGPMQAKPLPQPRLSMAEEANLVNARYNRAWGRYSDSVPENDPNESRRILGQARRDRISAMIVALLQQNGPMTAKHISDNLRETDDQVRVGIRALSREGKITMGRRIRDGHLWGVT